MSLSRSQVLFMAAATGLVVANLYYCQPLVILIAQEFQIDEAQAGTITYLTQAGYALGLFFMVPLGDKLERKKQIGITTLCASIALILAAMSTNFVLLQVASLLIGMASIVPQLILPMAASLSSVEQRGRVIGTVMSGLLIGILVSRTVSGFVGIWLGWRGMFWIAAGVCFLLALIIQKSFPINSAQFKGTYKQLYASLLVLIKEQPVLREATWINSLSFAQFGAFWTTMVLLLSQEPFEYNSATIGLFGLVGACGAFAAPLVGKLGDRGDSRKIIGLGLLMMIASFVVFYFSSTSVVGLIVGIILIDLGLQTIHVSNQTRIYALLPEARNRLNTVFMAFSFLGTAVGSAFGLYLWKYFGWDGVCVGALFLGVGAAIIFLKTRKIQKL
ncbi:MFS transporter [Flavobacterium sp. JP2137]|uniref:MFS transporter n=1 Tax=Flavobacterium sp. JP2137 TaxID=3414510 RepID=UPI003D2FA45E